MSWATKTLSISGERARRALRRYTLTVRGPDGAARRVPVEQASLRVGAREQNDVSLAGDDAVSGLHFEIRAYDHGFVLRDLGSRNGTLVDGYRVGEITLRNGSVIQCGHSALTFELDDAQTEIAASRADRFGDAVGGSVRMREVFAVLERVAKSDSTVLVEGETGTGKDVVARALHAHSRRVDGPFVVLDCGATPASLFESELFGHERGAFTGAERARIGRLEEAHGGTLFLDEIGELPLDVQPKLLRALANRQVRPVGGQQTREVDVRVVAATHRDLAEEVARRAFREDLYYRIAVIRVELPPLRERAEDVPALVKDFVERRLKDDPARAAQLLASIDDAAWSKLAAHPWPGNVRELFNVLERSLALGSEHSLGEVSVGASASKSADGLLEVDLERPFTDQKNELNERFERAYVKGQLARHGGNISRAARASGLERTHFKRILKRVTD